MLRINLIVSLQVPPSEPIVNVVNSVPTEANRTVLGQIDDFCPILRRTLNRPPPIPLDLTGVGMVRGG